MNKKILALGIGTTLLSGIANADYIYDAAQLVKEQKIEISDLEERFTASEIKAVELKVKELQAKSNDKKNTINALTSKRARELKKAGTKISTEDQERDKTKDLEKKTKSKERQEEKDKILVGDLEKSVNRRFEKLENRVSNLEKRGKAANTKNSSNTVKEGTKKTTENKKEQKVSKKEAVDLVLRGKLGDGNQRKEALKKLGFTEIQIKEIQKEVNRIVEVDHIKVNLD